MTASVVSAKYPLATGVCGAARPKLMSAPIWYRDRPDLNNDQSDDAQRMRLSLSTLRQGMRSVDDCVRACLEQQQEQRWELRRLRGSRNRPPKVVPPRCRFVSVSLSAPNWECSLYTHCNLTRLTCVRGGCSKQ